MQKKSIPTNRDRRKRPELSDSGFTLLELLISLTITAVIVTIVFGGLRVGIRAWEKGEAVTEFQDRYRNVLDLVRRQIVSVYIPPERKDSPSENELFYFKGESDSLAFVSHRSLFPLLHADAAADRSGVLFVRYRILDESPEEGGKRLTVYEENAGYLSKTLPTGFTAGEEDIYTLMAGAGDIRFEYLKIESVDQETGAPEWYWQNYWNSEEERTLPRAVRIVFHAEPASPPIHVVVPVEKNPIS